MDKLRYFLKEGIKNIWVNRIMSLASVSILTVCLLLLGSALLISYNVRELIAQVEDQNQIMVYLKDSVKGDAIEQLSGTLESMENVESVTYIPKSQVLTNQKKQLGKNAGLLSGFEKDNPYPNTFQVKIREMDQYTSTADEIKKLDGVESISANSEVANKLINISRVVGWVGFWLFILLAAVSLFLIANTIKLAVFVRRREVNIMKFVGATDWFIRWPFVVEGLILGILAGLLGIVVQYYLYNGLIARMFTVLNVSPVPFGNISAAFTGAFIACGVLLGVAGSLVSVRKYLKA